MKIIFYITLSYGEITEKTFSLKVIEAEVEGVDLLCRKTIKLEENTRYEKLEFIFKDKTLVKTGYFEGDIHYFLDKKTSNICVYRKDRKKLPIFEFNVMYLKTKQ